MRRRYLKATVFLVVLFAVSLPLYYAFSYGKNDGLQQTLQEGGGPAEQSWWAAPFSYGADPVATFLAGLLGFVVVLAAAYGVVRVSRRKGGRDGAERGPVDRPRT